MNVAICANKFPVASQTFVKRHVKYSFDGKAKLIVYKKSGLIEVDYVSLETKGVLGRGQRKIESVFNFLLDSPRGTLRFLRRRKAKKFLIDNNVECVIFEFGTCAIPLYSLLCELEIPYFVYFRGYDASKSLRDEKIISDYKKVIGNAKAVFSVAQYLLDELSQSGIFNKYSYVLPSGVDTNLFVPTEKKKGKIVFAGRLVEKKQPYLVLRAVHEVIKLYPHVSFFIIGDGPLRGKLISYISSNNLTEKVCMLGELDHVQVRQHLSDADILVQHSVTAESGDSEGAPSIIQEGMSCGCGVVATLHAGIPELISSGVDGLLVPEHDESLLYESIIEFIRKPEYRLKIANSGRLKAISEFDCWELQKQFEDIVRFHLDRG
ncbi:glycosyltransferase [Halomonas sp. BC04]|uniref:glycosyltransferase n=1 Tax=Halomonas sp. BC04 TaxID=1403540 RepID=UPI0004B9D86A|nr:glycosyltransferase [Halomonas sp. BC04]